MATHFKRLLAINIKNTCKWQFSGICSQAEGKNSAKWHLYSAVCVQRKPTLTTSLTDLEIRYSALTKQLDFENSLKSDHELRLEADNLRIAQLKKGELEDSEVENLSIQTAQDFEDASAEEFHKFQPASRTTEADKTNDTKSLNRALENHLVLVVKQQLGKTTPWVFPQGLRLDGESMRQTAERVLTSTCGENLQVGWLGNAPIGFYSYKYPADVQNATNCTGGKIFFFLARYVGGELVKKEKIDDFMWLTPSELHLIVKPRYHRSVKQFVLDDSAWQDRQRESENPPVEEEQRMRLQHQL